KGAASRRQGRRCASRLRRIKPARSRTFRCLVMEGALREKGSDNSLTDVSPDARTGQNGSSGGVPKGGKSSASSGPPYPPPLTTLGVWKFWSNGPHGNRGESLGRTAPLFPRCLQVSGTTARG